MRLLKDLERLAAQEQSLFRAQLLREDIARLRKLQEIARGARDAEAFKKAGARIGWTQGDSRTHELRETLDRLLEAVYALEQGEGDEAREACEAHIVESWIALHRDRMEKLVGCLSTPVPRPAD
jgi:hypothetical protein